ncbi:hypothetical protein COTS27_00881 [Spirochaetota bacterium]|nr:hypothetical protein COTS27_00881 [Spirochaetota bacterium]
MTMETKQNTEKTIDRSNTKTIDDDKPALYTPSHIANYFLAKKNHDIDNLKLNKLVYISYGWGTAIGIELFDEPIQAWKLGPVIPSLYHEFKHFGSKIITEMSKIYNLKENEVIIPEVEKGTDSFTLLKKIADNYGKISSLDLVDITHREDTPWNKTYYDEKVYKHTNKFHLEIPKDVIKEYYSSYRK